MQNSSFRTVLALDEFEKRVLQGKVVSVPLLVQMEMDGRKWVGV